MLLDEWFTVFRMMLPLSSRVNSPRKNVLLTAEDEGTMISANTGNHSPNATKSHPRKRTFLILYGSDSSDKGGGCVWCMACLSR